ncbi:MGS-like domain-containing protein [Phytophthora infestans]|uniref:MGS-like domain-containing protein n=1 Tax=Phytophthora infestans TaxID=4787 RepID=A0A8S9UYY7_PHYIN|nr:MGS-like domain-containing protein [Phytophthora infestans]
MVGVKMASTDEVAWFGTNMHQAYLRRCQVYATLGTHEYLVTQGGKANIALRKLSDLQSDLPSVIDYISPGKIELAINVPEGTKLQELTIYYKIRRAAVDFGWVWRSSTI